MSLTFIVLVFCAVGIFSKAPEQSGLEDDPVLSGSNSSVEATSGTVQATTEINIFNEQDIVSEFQEILVEVEKCISNKGFQKIAEKLTSLKALSQKLKARNSRQLASLLSEKQKFVRPTFQNYNGPLHVQRQLSEKTDKKKYQLPRLVSAVLRNVSNSKDQEDFKSNDYLEKIRAIHNSSCPTTQKYIEEVLNGTINPQTEREYFLHHRYLFKPEIRNLFVHYSPRATLSTYPFQLTTKKAQEIAKFIVLTHEMEAAHSCNQIVAALDGRENTNKQPIWRF